MKAERLLNVVFFKTAAGNEPVREWLKRLPRDECQCVGVDILKVQSAWPLGKPLVDHLGDGVWELRSRLDAVRGGGRGDRPAARIHQEDSADADG